jgi:hypothetical protein
VESGAELEPVVVAEPVAEAVALAEPEPVAEAVAVESDGESDGERGKAGRAPIAGMTQTVSNRCS